jgi:hypothetical protein
MYYSVDNKTDKEVGNVFPQATCLTKAQAHMLRADQFPASEPSLEFELEKKAKLTDVVSEAAMGTSGLLISQKLKALLEEFSLMRYKMYPVRLITKKGDETYFWLHLVDPELVRKIDYPNSVFYWTDCSFREDIIKLNTFNDYAVKKKANGALWDVEVEKLRLLPAFTSKPYDLFKLSPISTDIFISQKLKQALEAHQITGLEIKEGPFS